MHDSSTQPRARRGGFTLVEMLVVVGIILLTLTIALPAFTTIIGSRSQEAARNVVAASLNRARGEAIRRGLPCGVFFFVDPDTKQSALAICTLAPLTDPDPYDEYKSFVRGGQYQGGTYDPLTGVDGEPPMTADRAIVLSGDTNSSKYVGSYAAFSGRPVVLTMQHTSRAVVNAAGTGTDPNPGLSNPGDDSNVPNPNSGADVRVDTANTNAPVLSGAYWSLVDDGTLEVVDGTDVQRLPAGIGVQVILKASLLDADDVASARGTAGDPATFVERYARSGLVVFGPDGRVQERTYQVGLDSRLGKAMDLRGNGFTFINGGTSLGLVLYNDDAFQNAAADGTAINWKKSNGQVPGIITSEQANDVITGFTTSEGDLLASHPYPKGNRPQDVSAAAAESILNEYAEERWLDANTSPLLVNRYSGTLAEAD